MYGLPDMGPLLMQPKAQTPSGPTGLAALLARPGLRDALLAGGAALLQQSNQGGSLGSALGNALPVGMQAFQMGKQNSEIDALMAGAPPEMRQLLKALPPRERVAALLNLMKPPEDVVVGKNDRLVRGGEVILDAVPERDKPPAEIQTFREFMAMPPEQQAAYMQFLAAKRPPGTTVNVNAAEGGVQKAIGEAVYGTISGSKSAQAAVDKVAAIDRIVSVISNPKFEKVSGPLFGNKWGELAARFSDDPEARQLLAEFNAIGGQMTMDQLEEFTGPKTDFEFRQAKRLVLNEPSMTPAEIQAGLKVHRDAAAEQAKRWADQMLELDPSRLKFDPRDVAPQLELAQQISRQYDGKVSGNAKTPQGQRLLKLLQVPE